jgi:hypothetical protein
MALPIIGGIYSTLARFGYKYLATPLKPSKLGSTISKYTPKAVKDIEFSPTIAKGVEGAKQKVSSGYRALYGSTLGTQKGRQVAGGALGTYTTMSFLNRDDEEETIE